MTDSYSGPAGVAAPNPVSSEVANTAPRPQEAQARPMPVDAAALPKITLQELDLDVPYQGVAASRTSPSEPAKTERGVVVNGKFLEVPLPPDVEVGEQVSVKVTQQAGTLQAVVKPAPEPFDSVPVSEHDALSQLLKALKFSESDVKVLREIVRSAPESQSVIIPEKVAKELFANHEAVLNEQTITDREKLFQLLSQGSVKVDTTKLYELVQKTELKGEAVLSKDEIEFAKTLIKVIERITTESAEPEAQSARPERPLAALLELFQSGGSKVAKSFESLESKFVSFVNQQIEYLREVEESITEAVETIVRASDEKLLLLTVKKALDLNIPERDPVVQKFQKILLDLREGLETLSDTTSHPEELRKLATKTLEKLNRQLPPSNDSGMPRAFQQARQTVELQLQAIVANVVPDGGREVALNLQPLTEGSLMPVINLFKNVTQRAAEGLRHVEKKVIDFVASQLEFLVGKEDAIRSVIERTRSESGLPLLLHTLGEVDISFDQSTAPAERVFRETIGKIRESIERGIRDSSIGNDGPLRAALRNALETLQETYGDDLPAQKSSRESTRLNPPAELPREHQIVLRSVDAQIKTILSLPDLLENVDPSQSQNPSKRYTKEVDTLQKLLGQLDLQKLSAGSIEEKKLAQLIAEFRTGLGDVAPSTIKKLLKDFAIDLKSFLLPESGADTKSQIPPLPMRTPHAVRELHELLQRLLSEPADLLEQLPGGHVTPGKAEDFQVRTILHSLKDVISASARGASGLPELESVLSRIAQKLGELLEHKEPSLTITSKFHQIVREAVDSLQQFSASKNLPPDIKVNGRSPQETVERVIRELVRARDGIELLLIQQQVEDLGVPSPQSGKEQQAPIVKLTHELTKLLANKNQIPAQEILPILKQFVEMPVHAPTKAEQELRSAVINLAHDLEVGDSSNESTKKSSSKKGFEQLREKILANKYETKEFQEFKQQLHAYRSIENLVRGQEMIQRLSPVMQAVGEPAMLLFPMLLQNFLAKLEVSFYPSPVDNEESKRKKRGAGDGFERLQLKMTLPHMGEIRAALAYRDEELHLHLTVQNEQVAGFIESKVPLLEKILQQRNYHKLDIKAVTAPPGPQESNLLRELTRSKGIIA